MNKKRNTFNRKVNYIQLGYKQNYTIHMKNYTLNTDTGEESVSELKSNYHREIYEVPAPQVGYTRYILDNTFYKSEKSNNFITWNFAKENEFYHCLYCLTDTNLKNEYYQEGELESPYPSLEESFRKHPRLPSVYLLVMQAFDIITFDAFVSMINSSFMKITYSSEYSKIEELAERNIDIGTGIYANSSYYKNKNLFIRFIGKGVYQNQSCWIIDLDAEPSDVYMKEKNSGKMKSSKSLYSGCIYLSVETGDLLYGELEEDVVATDKSHKFTKRKIIIKNGEG